MKKLVSMLLIAVFLASLISVTSNAALPASAVKSNWDLEGIDGTPDIIVEGAQPDTGNPWVVITLDWLDNSFYYQTFECVLQGTHANIWIGLNDTNWDGYQDYYDSKGPGFDDDEFHFMYPWTWSGIPEYGIPAGYHDVIYGRNLTYILNEFDTVIHDTDVESFGMYADRPGPLNDYKIQILIFNIRDWLFWTPVEAPYFVQGYFWDYASWLNNANIIHIDTWQWVRRLGPNPPVPNPRPHEYEGVVAHEFQHLINNDVDPDELSWVNEGLSMIAEYYCGYGLSPGHISEYLIYWWDTSLVIWQGELSNYGAVQLWTLYMHEHYGGKKLIWDIAHEQANGIAGWNNVLKKHHIRKNFDQIFQDWAIANYLDDTSLARGIYGYYALDIPSDDTMWESIQYELWWWQDTYGTDWFNWQVFDYPNYGYNYPYGSSLPYVVNYVEFYDGEPAIKIHFDGDDYVGVIPHSGTYEWHSGFEVWSWYRLGQTFNIPTAGATLKFWSCYEIEKDWDYGYVEVHDLDTDEWYTLKGLKTVSKLTVQDNPYCPDEFEPLTYKIAGRWNAFTGSSGGWYQETMNLTPFAGHNIELYFTYWTDGAANWLGWYIDNVEIPEISFFDDVESGSNDWTYNGWYITDGIAAYNHFEVNFIQTLEIYLRCKQLTLHYIRHMRLNDETEEGLIVLPMISAKNVVSGPTVMVAANQPGYEHSFGTFYYFEADVLHFPCYH